MTTISEIIASDDFQRRLQEGRGTAPQMMVYRGASEGHSVDDGQEGAAIAGLEECIDAVVAHVGLKLRSAAVYCDAQRATMTLRFALCDLEDDLAIYHDTATKTTTVQVIHPDRIEIDAGSQSALLALMGAPYEVLALHFKEEYLAEVEGALRRLRLEPKPPTQVRQEVYTMGLQEV